MSQPLTIVELHAIPNGFLPDPPTEEEATTVLQPTDLPPNAITALVSKRGHRLERFRSIWSEFNEEQLVVEEERGKWRLAGKPTFPCVYHMDLVQYRNNAMGLGVRRQPRATKDIIKTFGFEKEYDLGSVESYVLKQRNFYEVGGIESKKTVSGMYAESILKLGNSRVVSWMRLVEEKKSGFFHNSEADRLGEDIRNVIEVRFRRGEGMGNKLVLAIGKRGENQVEFDAGRLLTNELIKVGILVDREDVCWFVNGSLIRWVRLSRSFDKLSVSYGREGEMGTFLDADALTNEENREFLVYYIRSWEVRRTLPFRRHAPNLLNPRTESASNNASDEPENDEHESQT